MSQIETKIGYKFKNAALLKDAFTHSSYANENPKSAHSNERLEFLGDAVLGFLAAEWLYKTYPGKSEGELTRIRAGIVCEQSLAETARELDIGSLLRLGKGEESGGGRNRQSMQADAVEALLSAVYLDAGIDKARDFVMRFIIADKLSGEHSSISADYKTLLQEIIQRDRSASLSYNLTGESGPDHDKRFFVEVLLNDAAVGRGEGKSKKEAEQRAARDAYEKKYK